MAISRPEPRRRLKLPRNLPGTRQLQPYSRVDAPYFRSPGFYVRVGGLAIVVAAGLSLLLLRAWSIQVLHGKQYAQRGAPADIPDGQPARRARRDRRRPAAADRRHVRTRRHRRRRGLARLPERARSLEPEPGRRPCASPPGPGHRQALGHPRCAHPPRRPAEALRTRRRRRPPDRRPGGVPAGAARPVPRVQGGGRGVTELSAGRLRQRVPRPARPDQQAES